MQLGIKKDAEKFVAEKLVDKGSYILNGYLGNNFYQFEYKVQKSEAARKLELHENALVEIPKWIVYFSVPVMIFLIAFFTGALITMSNVKPDGIYGQSCVGRSCSKALNLKCINQTCKCESPKYYTNKCVDLSKYGEKCVSRDNCDPSQDMICIGSICSCAPTKYWNSNKCADRLTYGQTCVGDQCRIRVNLVCSSSGMCDCVDNTLYFWDSSVNECVAKKRYSLSCASDFQCLDSELTICKSNKYCLCIDKQYYDGSNCVDRVGEFVSCKFDDMCLSPMFCSTADGCSCATYYYFDLSILNCVEQKSFEEPCLSNHHCREDKQLFCGSDGICVCKSQYSWSSTADECKLTYLQGTCTRNSQCNSDEKLICATNTNCNCPSDSFVGKCDCIRQSGNENYWDSSISKCVDTFSFNSSCTHDYECKTLTQLTKCISGKCDCEEIGGFTSWNKCKKCKDDEYYFNDKCYYFSTDDKKNNKADGECKDYNRNSRLLVIETNDELDFISEIVNEIGNDDYWISGRKTKSWWFWSSTTYSWRPVSNLQVTGCSVTSDKDCLYYSYSDVCYKSNRNCDNQLKYICEY